MRGYWGASSGSPAGQAKVGSSSWRTEAEKSTTSGKAGSAGRMPVRPATLSRKGAAAVNCGRGRGVGWGDGQKDQRIGRAGGTPWRYSKAGPRCQAPPKLTSVQPWKYSAPAGRGRERSQGRRTVSPPVAVAGRWQHRSAGKHQSHLSRSSPPAQPWHSPLRPPTVSLSAVMAVRESVVTAS